MCGISGELLNFEIRKSIAKTQQQSQQVLPLFLASKSCYQTKQTLQNAIPMKTFKNFQGIFFYYYSIMTALGIQMKVMRFKRKDSEKIPRFGKRKLALRSFFICEKIPMQINFSMISVYIDRNGKLKIPSIEMKYKYPSRYDMYFFIFLGISFIIIIQITTAPDSDRLSGKDSE